MEGLLCCWRYYSRVKKLTLTSLLSTEFLIWFFSYLFLTGILPYLPCWIFFIWTAFHIPRASVSNSLYSLRVVIFYIWDRSDDIVLLTVLTLTSSLTFSLIFYRGRFSLRGSELGWTKSWFMNLGLGEESTAKIKLRMGLNLKSYKVDRLLCAIVLQLYKSTLLLVLLLYVFLLLFAPLLTFLSTLISHPLHLLLSLCLSVCLSVCIFLSAYLSNKRLPLLPYSTSQIIFLSDITLLALLSYSP